jgi:hypothetical protein
MRRKDWGFHNSQKLLRLIPGDEGYVEGRVCTCCL